MSRIDELIKRYCPDGVEYVPLNEAFDLRNGFTPSKSNAGYWTNGEIPWFRMEDIREYGRNLSGSLQLVNMSALKGSGTFEENSIIMSTSATIGEHALITIPFLANQRFTIITRKPAFKDRLEPRFVFYFSFRLAQFCKENTHVSGFAGVDMDKFRKFAFAIPPLEVQREIVSILDTFTQLEAELEAELEARKRQLRHFSTQLLSFEPTFYAETVEQLCEVNRGRVMSKDYLRDNQGEFPVYSSQTLNNGIFGYINNYDYDFESLTWTTDGANAGSIFYHVDEKFSITNVCGLLKVRNLEQVSTKYLYLQLNHMAKKYVKAGMGNPKLMSNIMKSISIPLPERKIQDEIVQALESLEWITRDLSSGLPAEIAARRQQYEYYRDQLLTFNELTST